jgi:hypothetical protein
MKNLILLLLVIGAVVNAVDLTTVVDPASIDDPLWTIAYNTATASRYYTFTVTYYGGPSAITPIVAETTGGTNDFGVICVFTESTFAPAVSNANNAFSFAVPSTTAASSAVGATTGATARWGTPTMQSYPLITYAATPTLTVATVVSCPIAMTQAGAPLPVITSFTASWTFTVAAACGNLPPAGATWYAVCYAVKDQVKIIAATPTITLVGTKNVTVTTAATACATTTGASTFATGATILAGIAYLQF